MTFGKVHGYGPDDETLVIAGVSGLAVAAGAALAIINRLIGGLVTIAGLAISFAAYAGWLVTRGAVPLEFHELALLATMVVGLLLLVRLAQRDGLQG